MCFVGSVEAPVWSAGGMFLGFRHGQTVPQGRLTVLAIATEALLPRGFQTTVIPFTQQICSWDSSCLLWCCITRGRSLIAYAYITRLPEN